MATVEGRGLLAPSPKFVVMHGDELEIIRAAGRVKAQKYETRADSYGKGYMATSTDPTFHGDVGEAAFAKWMNREMGRTLFVPDMTLKAKGDGGIDFRAAGLTFDVKAVTAPADSDLSILVRRSDNGRLYPLNSDIYPCVSTHDLLKPALLGWVRKSQMVRFAKSPRRDATHFNIEIPRADLLPMNRLVALMRSRQGRAA